MNWININPPVSRSLFSSCSFEFWSELTKARKLQLQNELFAIMDGFSQDWPHLTRTDNGLQMDQLVGDLHGDEGFEPQQRGRSNTWPCPRPENFVEPNDELDSTKASNQQLATCGKLGHIYIFLYLSVLWPQCPYQTPSKPYRTRMRPKRTHPVAMHGAICPMPISSRTPSAQRRTSV